MNHRLIECVRAILSAVGQLGGLLRVREEAAAAFVIELAATCEVSGARRETDVLGIGRRIPAGPAGAGCAAALLA